LILAGLHAGQPINGDGTAGGVAPELDELLNGEDTSEVLDASAILGMATFELVVGHGITGDPTNVGNAKAFLRNYSFSQSLHRKVNYDN
jgi:hypothetical protein